jgi:protein TonB
MLFGGARLHNSRLNQKKNSYQKRVTNVSTLHFYYKHVYGALRRLTARFHRFYLNLKIMEPKKNPKYDVHRNRGVLLNVGLIVSLILVISAFKWKVAVRPDGCTLPQAPIGELLTFEDPRVTEFKKPTAAPPAPIKPVILHPTNVVEATAELAENNEPQQTIDQGQDPAEFAVGSVDIPAEVAEPDTFRVVEKMPEPVGGWAAFYKTLGKNIKYPKPALRMGTKGKVFVEFTINDKGQLSHFKVIKGIGDGCDEEAARVLALTKWNPGKQRGRPVNVRLVQPIVFDLTR